MGIMMIGGISKVVVGDDRMIVCREADLAKIGPRKLVKLAFPEIFSNWLARCLCFMVYDVVYCYRHYSSKFGCQVGQLENEHDWDRVPFVVLRVIEDEGEWKCSAEALNVPEKKEEGSK